MKITFKILVTVVLLSTLFICSCSNKTSNAGKCSLTIVCDSSIKFKLLSNAFLTNDHDTLIVEKVDYDSAKKETTLSWDSLKIGEYTYHIKSVFDFNQNAKLILKTDTIINLKSKIRYQFVDFISENDLLDAETIAFAYRATGCYYYLENYMLKKEHHAYHLSGSYKKNGVLVRINKRVSSSIINSLNRLQVESSQCIKKEIRNNIKQSSTMTGEFFLFAKNKVCYINNSSHCECLSYYSFIDQYVNREN
jgi:hypothetical protein